MRVRYMTKEMEKEYGINLADYPGFGPYGNVTGMKKLYYGDDALLVKQGAYVYKVPEEIYYLAK